MRQAPHLKAHVFIRWRALLTGRAASADIPPGADARVSCVVRSVRPERGATITSSGVPRASRSGATSANPRSARAANCAGPQAGGVVAGAATRNSDRLHRATGRRPTTRSALAVSIPRRVDVSIIMPEPNRCRVRRQPSGVMTATRIYTRAALCLWAFVAQSAGLEPGYGTKLM